MPSDCKEARAAVSFVSTDVNGYTEQGPAAQYEYQDRTVQAASGEVSLRAEGGNEGFSFYVEGGYRDSFGDSSDAVRTRITANPAQILSRKMLSRKIRSRQKVFPLWRAECPAQKSPTRK